MKIVFCGSQELGFRSLECLLKMKQEISIVFTFKSEAYENWEYDVGRYAKEKGLHVEYTRRIDKEPFISKIREIQPDWLLLAGWRDIVPESVFNIPRLGSANVHSSCLPEGRGFSPFNWPILLGMESTGVTIFKLDEGIDTGKILAQKDGIPITPKETYGSLANKMVPHAVELIKDVVEKLDSGQTLPKIQLLKEESFFARRVPQDSQIDWGQSALEIDRLVRASNPAPIAYTYLRTQRDGICKIFIHETQISEWKTAAKEATAERIIGVPGNWLGVNEEGVAFLTGKGDRILIKKISLESEPKTIILAKDFKPLKSITARVGRKYLLMD